MDIKLLPRRSFKKPLSFGHFEWEDEMVEKKISGVTVPILCASNLEILAHDDIEHALAFILSLSSVDGEMVMSINVKYVDGKLEQNTFLDFKLSISKQNTDGEFSDVFRNVDGRSQSPLIGPISKDKFVNYHFPYVHRIHKLTNADFDRRAKVKVELFLSIHCAKPKLTDKTEPRLEKLMHKLCLNDELSDLKIVCDGQEFPCHKLILSARSDVFKAMFTSDLKFIKNEESILEIPDISAETMKTFLQFIYKDDVEVEDIDQNLLIAADK